MGLAEFDHDLISRFSRFSAPSHELTIPFETSIVGRINHLWQRSLRGTSEGADVESSTPTELEERSAPSDGGSVSGWSRHGVGAVPTRDWLEGEGFFRRLTCQSSWGHLRSPQAQFDLLICCSISPKVVLMESSGCAGFKNVLFMSSD